MLRLNVILLIVGWLSTLATLDECCEAATALHWSQLAEIPEKRGLGGPFVGTHNGALIVCGGTNFPNAPPWDGGEKVWYDAVYVLDSPSGKWFHAGALPRRLAYGLSISTRDGLLLIGGDEKGNPRDSVYRLSWDPIRRTVDTVELQPLPLPASNIAGGLIDSTVYVAASTRSPGADRLDTKHFWAIDLRFKDGHWRELEPWPGAPRQQAVAAVQQLGDDQSALFLFSGANPRWRADGTLNLEKFSRYTDGYRYSPSKGAWQPITELPALPDSRDIEGKHAFEDERWPVIAATAASVGQSHILVFSGSTGRYLSTPLDKYPTFPRKVLAYNTITDTWSETGEMPTGVVTTTAAIWEGDDPLIVIPSGETKPGVRTPMVQAVSLRSIPATFGAINYAVLTIYLLAMVGIGGFFSLRTKSTDDFFRGGQRVPFWIAGLSIFATMLSSITFIALPAKTYATDWTYYPAQLTIIPVALIVVLVAIPFFRAIDATSAYEYLEKRFSRSVRLIGSAQFIMFQLGRMAIVMYLPALALAAITPLTVIQCILLMGALSIIYCTMGGVEAVVWTDAVQTIVLIGGLLIALAVIAINVDGGITALWSTAWQDGKLKMANLDGGFANFSSNALWIVLIGTFFQSLYSYTSDQAIVQRYMTTSSLRDARRAMWTTVFMGAIGSLLFFVVGSALYVFYKNNPLKLDPLLKTDAVFPLFISEELPIGLAGLVVAGVFAAAQSTISTSLNSTATAIVTDFLKPFNFCTSDRGYLLLGRIFTVTLGLLGTALACVFDYLEVPSMFDEFMTLLGLFGGALCGLFMLGMLTQRSNSTGGLVGVVVGIIVVWFVKYYTSVSFLLYAMIATLTTFVIGYLASLISSPDPQDVRSLTIYGCGKTDAHDSIKALPESI